MNARFFSYYLKDGSIKMKENHQIVNSVVFDERLDEQLDTGSVQTKETSGEEEKFQDFQACNLIIEQELNSSNAPSISKWFRGFSSNHKRGENYYIYSHELVEPTRALMGITIDGKKITQPIDGRSKKTLQEVVEILLNTAELLTYDGTSNSVSKFEAEQSSLLDVESPEFNWESGTLLWECLLDIGNVINCIPRLTVKPNAFGTEQANLNYLVFEKVNDIKGVYEL
jgi:hypothetical protein